MYTLRKSDERGRADHGWLTSRFTFSFADYFDPEHSHFGSLRVLNDDWIAPQNGFGMHPHRDMEIFSFVTDGQLMHRDSEGHESIIAPGRVQLMGAGTGIRHSEFNPTSDAQTHLYQVWIMPRAQGLAPSYQELDYDPAEARNRLKLLADASGTDGALTIRQAIAIYTADLEAGHDLTLPLHGSAWLQLHSGTLQVGDQVLHPGDGLGISAETHVVAHADTDARFLYFNMSAHP